MNRHNPSLENQETAKAHQLVLQVLHGCHWHLFPKSPAEIFLITIQFPLPNKNYMYVKSVWHRPPASPSCDKVTSQISLEGNCECFLVCQKLLEFSFRFRWKEVRSDSVQLGCLGPLDAWLTFISRINWKFAVPYGQTNSLPYLPWEDFRHLFN